MGILKKIKASTLVEVITASIIISIVFVIASMTLNNVFASTIKNDINEINNYLHKLEYQYINKQVSIPLNADYKNWAVTISKVEERNVQWIVFEAENAITKKRVEKKQIDVEY